MRTVLLLVSLLLATSSFSQNYSKVKINTDNAGLQTLAELGLAVDHGERKFNQFFITDLSESDIAILDANGFDYEIVVDNVKEYYATQNTFSAKNVTCAGSGAQNLPQTPENFFMNATYAGFYKYQDMLDALDSMVAMYPNLITVKAPISTFQTHEGRPIYFVKISDDPNTDDASEPNALFTAIHHAREPLSMSQTIFYMWYLLENYATNQEVQYLVDNTELFFVPCINPDGYIHNETNDPNGFGMHRKNKAPVGTSNPGVDLNRNYSYGWNTTGVSADPNNDTYPGTSAFSEPETQAMKWLVETYGFKTAMNSHTYGELLLFPVGTTTAEFADHHDYFVDLSGHMVKYNHYLAQKSSGLYPASGDSDDYMYKVDIGVGMKDTIFAMTPEVGTDFWPAQNEVESTCAGMLFTNMVMAHITHKYLVVDDTDPLMISTTSGNFNHEVQRLGFESGNVEVSIVPIANIQSVGPPVNYDINWHTTDVGSISFVLDPAIQFGDQVVYDLVTDYGGWQHHDTITKIYDQWALVIDDDASSAGDWTGTWSLTSDDAYSPSTSFADSDGGDYGNNDYKTWEYVNSIDLTNANNAMITFFAKWEIEADYDYCQFQVSANDGATWEGQCGLYTVEGSSTVWNGSVQPDGEPVWEGSSDWIQERIELSDYIGETIKVRFVFGSDGGVSQDGFYFDDFQLTVDGLGGLDENGVANFAVAPNPTKDMFTLSADYAMSGNVIIMDRNGKLVKSHPVNNGQKQVQVSTSDLPAGVYFVTVDGGYVRKNPAKLVVIK